MRIRDILREGTAPSFENAAFQRYFATRPVSFDNEFAWECGEHYLDLIGEAERERMAAEIGADIEDLSPGWINSLSDADQRAFADWMETKNLTGDWLYQDPASAPAWMHMDFVRSIPNSTWVAHFSDHAAAIKQEGFRFGVPEIDNIGLTREHHGLDSTVRIEQTEPGYNFGYLATGPLNQRIASNAMDGEGYGAHAILFRTGGAILRHHGDREEQVCFWGPDASLRPSLVLSPTENGWTSDTGVTGESIEAVTKLLLTRPPRRKAA